MYNLSVLGGHGFIGSNFWKRHCDGLPDWTTYIPGAMQPQLNDRTDYDPKRQHVITFISTVDNYNILKDPHEDINTNLHTLITALQNWKIRQNCRADNNGVFNFISSWFVYGGDKERSDVKEDEYCDPRGFYSITKRTAEQMLISYCETFRLKYRIFRLGNVIGPGDKKVSKQKNALQYMVNEMKAGRDIELYGDGQFFRDYIHVDDCVDAIADVMNFGEANAIYNIGNGKTWNFRDILYYCRRKLDANVKINQIEPKEFHKLVQVKSFYMNNDRIKSLGYAPKYLNETLYDTLL
jgi:nucleoside-diphosphate-sugar epimerase